MAINNVCKGFHRGLEITTYCVTHSDPLEKAAKLAERIIRIAEIVTGQLSKAVSNLGSQLKNCIIVFETLKFVGIMNILVNPTNGKYFLTDPKNSWQKRLDRVTLAFHCAFKSVRGLNKFGLVELGAMAKNAIGQLPIFTLVMDSFILASSFFSSWDSFANNLPKANKSIRKADKHLDKWQYRQTAITLLKAGEQSGCSYFEDSYSKKLVKLRSKLQNLEKTVRLNEGKIQKALDLQKEPDSTPLPKADQDKMVSKCTQENKELALKIKTKQVKLAKTEARFQKITSGEFKELAGDLEKTNSNFKVKKWEVEQSNAKQDRSKVWLQIANAIGKIAVVTLALTLTAINLWAAPFMLSLLFLGTLVDSIGLTKILVSEFWKKKPVPTQAAVLS